METTKPVLDFYSQKIQIFMKLMEAEKLMKYQ